MKWKCPSRCETIITYANPFTIGGTALTQESCLRNTTTIIREKSTGEKLGCCGRCLVEFRRINKGELKLYGVTKRRKK